MALGTDITASRSLHDLGLATWFGGSLAGAVGFNGASADVDDPTQRARVANAAWARWTPVSGVGIGAHLVGAVRLLQDNKGRTGLQKGVGASSTLKAVVTAGALGATAYSRVLGKKIQDAGDVPVAGGTDPLPTTPPEVAKAQKQLKILQWVIPGLTGVLIVLTAKHGEQQRPLNVVQGLLEGIPERAGTLASGAADALKGAGSAAAVKAKH